MFDISDRARWKTVVLAFSIVTVVLNGALADEPGKLVVPVVDDIKITGKWKLSGDAFLSIGVSENGRTAIHFRSATLTLPRKCYVRQMEMNNGLAALLVVSRVNDWSYDYPTIIVCKLNGENAEFSTCAQPREIARIGHPQCLLSRLKSIDKDGILQIEISYNENPQPPTRVLREVILWNSETDREMQATKPQQ